MSNFRKALTNNYNSIFQLALAIIILPIIVQASNLKSEIEKENYEGKQFVLRKIINHSTIFYADPPLDTSMVYAQYEDNRIFLYRKDRLLEIKKLKFKDSDNLIILEYFCNVTGKQEIKFISPKGNGISKNVFEALFSRLFTLPSDSSDYEYYMIDTTKATIHLRGANHIPVTSFAVSQNDLDSLEDYKLCKACFNKQTSIPDLDEELALSRAIAVEYRIYNQIIVIDSLQDYIKAIGKRVLSNWPLPLRGYDYDFIVVKNKNPNALALPAGTIFIHSSLIELAGDEKELEAVLAHEIAHVELRHGYRQVRKAKKDKLLGKIFSAATGVVVGLATDDAEAGQVAMDIATIISEISTIIAIQGYSRDSEREADELSSLYMFNKSGKQENIHLCNILNKLKYFSGFSESNFKEGALDSHPAIITRIKRLRNLKFTYYDSPIELVGIDSLDREVITAYIHFVTSGSYEKYIGRATGYKKRYLTSVYLSLASTEYLYSVQEIKDFSMGVGDQHINFDNKDDTPMAPLTKVSCVFSAETKKPIILENFAFFYIPLSSVKLWGIKK